MEDKQKLVDICFELVATTHIQDEYFKDKTLEQKMEWVADQLRKMGFDTTPCGSLWGVLKNK